MISVALIEDERLTRESLAALINRSPGLRCVAEFASAEQAIAALAHSPPDVALIDLGLPGMSGIECVRQLASSAPATRLLVLTKFEDAARIVEALKAGAHGYVLKGVSARELANVVRASAHGEVYVSPSLAAGMMIALTRGRPPDPLEELTERELEILKLVGQGLTNREIGQRIHLSEKTIKHYITNILQKLQVRSRVEAALLAARHS